MCAGLLAACGSPHKPDTGLGKGTGGSGATAGAGTGGSANSGHGGSSGRNGSGGDSIKVEAGGEGGACERDVTLQAVTLGQPAPFDLVIVADHSQSLAWSKDELSAGLKSLLTNVKGRAVRIFLLTPTQYGASSAAARAPLSGTSIVSWQDPATGAAYEDAVTNYVQTCKDPTGAVITCPDPTDFTDLVPYTLHGEWQFVMPPPVALLTPDMSDAAFQQQQTAVADAILAIGGTGSPHEQPLCTLSRYVSQVAAKLPENVVMLVITDENDVSTPDECLLAFDASTQESNNGGSTTPCSSNCDAYRYQMSGTVENVEHPFTCAAFTDTGDLIPGTEKSQSYSQNGSCAGVMPSSTCTDDEKDLAQFFCDMGLTVTSCGTDCSSFAFDCSVDLPDQSVNACTSPFTYQGTTWPNLTAYCAQFGSGWHDCQVLGLNVEAGSGSWSGGYSHTSLMQGSTTADIASYFSGMRATAFAPGKSLLEGIVFDPSFSCTLGAGQSYATNITNLIADRSHVFPLCESYAPALDGVLDFAQTLVQTRYTLTLKDDEHVTAVVLIGKDGSERTLDKTSYTFDEATGLLDISPSAIRATDANLRVEVTSDCRPIVR